MNDDRPEFEPPRVERPVPSVAEILRRRWRLLTVVPLLFLALGIGYGLMLGDYYEAGSRFVAVGRIGSEGLGGIDERLQGFARRLGAMQLFESADLTTLLPSLITSRQYLDRVLDTTVETSDDSITTVLTSLGLQIEGERKHRYQARKFLREELIHLSTDEESGVSSLRTAHSDPLIAAAMANACVEELQSMARSIFAARASDEARFVSERLQEVGERLKDSENALSEFRDRNRLANQSPQLSLEEGRLARRVQINEQLFLTLRIQDELARLEEVKNTSVLWVLDRADPPIEPAGPKRVLIALTAFFAGLALTASFIVLRDYPLLG